MRSSPLTEKQIYFDKELDKYTGLYSFCNSWTRERVLGFRHEDKTYFSVVEIGYEEESIRIAGISVGKDFQGQGYASFTMKWLCNLADTLDLILTLKSKPFGRRPPMKNMDLKRWYKRLGFVPVRGNRWELYREPQKIRNSEFFTKIESLPKIETILN
jgi:GNAT superfamily N-acetyltransferase